MKLNTKSARFVRDMGEAPQAGGVTPTAGRLLGLLLLSQKPVSLDEACRLLGASKGPVSTNARTLLALGLAQRVRYPRDRRDYYEVAPGTFERQLSLRVEELRAWRAVAASGLEAVDAGDGLARSRLEEMHELCDFLGGEMEAMMGRWRARRGRSPAADI